MVVMVISMIGWCDARHHRYPKVDGFADREIFPDEEHTFSFKDVIFNSGVFCSGLLVDGSWYRGGGVRVNGDVRKVGCEHHAIEARVG